ncbi:MAG TPA: PDZ domain-containing protein [Thermoanaerobaculia bacterium]|nr:PDZ domain-containing protein [Thermoanaerobaculia bacterium]
MRRASLLLSIVFAAAAHAQPAPEPVRYTLRFPAAQTHYVEVEAVCPSFGAQQLEVMMPVWTPGSYLVREYARNVEDIAATTDRGESVPLEKTRKNRWRFPTRGAQSITLRYRVYGREMRVQTDFIGSDFALLNGAATFITPVDRLRGPYEVTLELPRSWSRSLSSMAVLAPNRFRAANYDELVDSPIVAGNPDVHEFTVAGKPHHLVDIGGEDFWDAARATADVQKIVEQHAKMWGIVPYDRYYFFNFIVDSGGGLEHKGSTVLMTRRFQMRTRRGTIDWFDLVSHEQFHAWNVKRLRPIALGPFDYENENYTSNLWISEGFTDYYGALDVERAGLMTPNEYLRRLSRTVESLQTTPGRLVEPVALASYDAWIKLYRPDENSNNTAISYYTKGAIVAWILDAKVRKATNGTRTLDDVMRTAYQRFSGPRGFTTDDFLGVVREIGGADVATWLGHAVSTTEDLDYSDALSWFGLQFGKQKESNGDDGEPKEPKAYLGAGTRVDGGRLMITQVKRGTPAFDAGLNVDDEIVALDDYRVPPDGFDTRLQQYRAGDEATLTVARRGKLTPLRVKFGEEPENVWRLRTLEKPAPGQAEQFKKWLAITE